MRLKLASALLCAWLAAAALAAEPFVVAFWNVENLFDIEDDPDNPGDEEFTPDSTKQWTQERFDKKVDDLAKVIRDMNDGRGPDVLGLAEVENRYVQVRLVERLAPLGRAYEVVHRDSPDKRGIDCALLFDGARLRLDSKDFLATPVEKTREIVEAVLTVEDDRLYVFVNHWPSRVSDETGKQRCEVASVLRRRIDEILEKDPAADIVVIGDMNDEPRDRSLTDCLRASGVRDEAAGRVLYNTTWTVQETEGRGSYNFRGDWQTIDQIVISAGLLDERGFRWRTGSTDVVMNEYQLFRPNTPQARPNRTYGGDNYYGGYSDHLPVVCVIER